MASDKDDEPRRDDTSFALNHNLAILFGFVLGFSLSGTWFYSLSKVEMSIETATFLGPFFGAAIGLIAILAGALYNAELSRKRDAMLRSDEKRTLAGAILAELSSVRAIVISTQEWLSLESKDADLNIVLLEWKSYMEIYHASVGKLGLFSPEIASDVVSVYLEFRAVMVLFEEGFRKDFQGDPNLTRVVTRMNLWTKSANALNVKLAAISGLPYD